MRKLNRIPISPSASGSRIIRINHDVMFESFRLLPKRVPELSGHALKILPVNPNSALPKRYCYLNSKPPKFGSTFHLVGSMIPVWASINLPFSIECMLKDAMKKDDSVKVPVYVDIYEFRPKNELANAPENVHDLIFAAVLWNIQAPPNFVVRNYEERCNNLVLALCKNLKSNFPSSGIWPWTTLSQEKVGEYCAAYKKLFRKRLF